MNESNLRRTNWTPQPGSMRASTSEALGDLSDPLEELQRALRHNGSFTPIDPQRPAMRRSQPSLDDVFSGIDPSAFEAALSKDLGAIPAARDETAGNLQAMPVTSSQPARARAAPDATHRDMFEAAASLPPVRSPAAAAPARDDDFGYEAAPNFDENVALAPIPRETTAGKRGQRMKGLGTVIVVLGLVAIGLAAVAAVSVFAWKASKATTGEPVIVRADPRPNRVVAETPPDAPGSNKVIFDRLPDTGKATQTERLVPREEQPAATLPPRQAAPIGSPPPAVQLSEPRRVATTTIRVRPDGSLESEPTKSLAETSVAHTLPGSPTALGNGRTNPLPTAPPPGVAAPVVTVPTITSTQPRAAAPNPALAKPVVREAPAATQPPIAQAPPAQSGGQGFMVQISSQRSREEATASFTNLQKRYPSLLSGQSPDIQEVDLGSKGTFYRVRLGPMQTRNEATDFCTKYKAAGGSCVVSAS